MISKVIYKITTIMSMQTFFAFVCLFEKKSALINKKKIVVHFTRTYVLLKSVFRAFRTVHTSFVGTRYSVSMKEVWIASESALQKIKV